MLLGFPICIDNAFGFVFVEPQLSLYFIVDAIGTCVNVGDGVYVVGLMIYQ